MAMHRKRIWFYIAGILAGFFIGLLWLGPMNNPYWNTIPIKNQPRVAGFVHYL
jgi:hypothetical protein